MNKNWRKQAEHLFFDCKKSIVEIEKQTGVSRRTLSPYLRQLPGYEKERERRKKANAESRKEYKRQWDRSYRSMGNVTGETIKREHDMAAVILSREKYR